MKTFITLTNADELKTIGTKAIQDETYMDDTQGTEFVEAVAQAMTEAGCEVLAHEASTQNSMGFDSVCFKVGDNDEVYTASIDYETEVGLIMAVGAQEAGRILAHEVTIAQAVEIAIDNMGKEV